MSVYTENIQKNIMLKYCLFSNVYFNIITNYSVILTFLIKCLQQYQSNEKN